MAKKTNKSGLSLNMLIARSHQVTTQLVGVQLSIANLLAIAVSAASVVAGTVTLTIQRYPVSWPLWIAAGIIGLGLAVLIEGMTLGGLIRIRLASARIRVVDNGIEDDRGRIDWVNLSKQQRKIHERELKRKRTYATKRDRRMRFWSVPIVLVGSFASAVAGGIFYHVALAGLGTWESIGVAALFPFVVTCTFISSELFKDIQEEAIKEGYTGGGLAGAAMHEEMDRLALQAVFNGIQDHFSHPDAQQALKDAALRLVNGKIAVIGLPQNGMITEVREEPRVEDVSSVLPSQSLPLPEPVAEVQAEEKASDVLPIEQASSTQTEDKTAEVLPAENTPAEEDESAKTGLLEMTIQYLLEHPHLLKNWTVEDEANLAQYLGLRRPTSARFWKIKAEDLIRRSAIQKEASGVEDQGHKSGRKLTVVGGRSPKGNTSVKGKIANGELLPIAEAASILKCTPRNVRDLRDRGTLEADASGLITAESINAHLAKRNAARRA